MKTFEAFLNEANEILYSININDKLKKFIIKILKDNDYRVDEESGDILVHPKATDKINSFRDFLYSEVSKRFEEGDEDIVKFVGSTREDDLINSDLEIDVNAVYR
jgi:hypothetical protein